MIYAFVLLCTGLAFVHTIYWLNQVFDRLIEIKEVLDTHAQAIDLLQTIETMKGRGDINNGH